MFLNHTKWVNMRTYVTICVFIHSTLCARFEILFWVFAFKYSEWGASEQQEEENDSLEYKASYCCC